MAWPAIWQQLRTTAALSTQRQSELLGFDLADMEALQQAITVSQPPSHTLRRERFTLYRGHLFPVKDPGPFDWSTASADYRLGWRSWHELQAAWGQPQTRERLPELRLAELVDVRSPPDRTAAWRAIPWEQDETWPLVLIETDQVAGYLISGSEWQLAAQADFTLPTSYAHVVVPELTESPDESALRSAWQTWARSRTIALSEADATRLSYAAGQLHVQPTPDLAKWLQMNRSDVFTNEVWLPLGGPEWRAAAQLCWSTSTSS